jgi:hypothetical protein
MSLISVRSPAPGESRATAAATDLAVTAKLAKPPKKRKSPAREFLNIFDEMSSNPPRSGQLTRRAA